MEEDSPSSVATDRCAVETEIHGVLRAVRAIGALLFFVFFVFFVFFRYSSFGNLSRFERKDFSKLSVFVVLFSLEISLSRMRD